jgi:hypothetical protein
MHNRSGAKTVMDLNVCFTPDETWRTHAGQATF